MKRIFASVVLLSLVAAVVHATQPAPPKGKRYALYSARPEYPTEAREHHMTGSGVFAMHVRPNGTVASVDVVKSTGYSILDRAAIAAFRRWRFHPGDFTMVKTPITFSMSGARY